jgi:hypothetical protein
VLLLASLKFLNILDCHSIGLVVAD